MTGGKGLLCFCVPPYAIYYMLLELNHRHKRLFIAAYSGFLALTIVMAVVAEFSIF